MMKTKVLSYLVKVLSLIAVICASTPSRYNMYEPDIPTGLKK